MSIRKYTFFFSMQNKRGTTTSFAEAHVSCSRCFTLFMYKLQQELYKLASITPNIRLKFPINLKYSTLQSTIWVYGVWTSTRTVNDVAMMQPATTSHTSSVWGNIFLPGIKNLFFLEIKMGRLLQIKRHCPSHSSTTL